MTKEQALEGWSFAEKQCLQDYLLADLDKAIELLSAEVLQPTPRFNGEMR